MAHKEVVMENEQLDKAIKQLLESYSSLNSEKIDELDEEPSALEFMRYVASNRPFVVRKGAKDWKSVQRWDADYLTNILGDSSVCVAITPFGNADAVLEKPDGSLAFVKPYEETRPFSEVIQKIRDQENLKEDSELVYYAQTQNDNLRGEYGSLFDGDVPEDVPFARIALQEEPDAINFWLGNSRSITALHKDNYENIYVQVRGRKHFVLLPPVAAPCVNEQDLPNETYAPVHDQEATGIDEGLRLRSLPDGNGDSTVPVATWDPDRPDERSTPYSKLLMPIRVTLEEGDMLYLPAMWFHKVSQSCGEEGFCVSINYWYDMAFQGSFWSTNAFIRDAARCTSSGSKLGPSNTS